MIIGYTTGVFDLFHVGHLNILRESKAMCDYLVVGCTTNNLVLQRKNKQPIIPHNERIEILKSIRYVDQVVIQDTMDKFKAYQKYKFNIMFVGDDWKNHPYWLKIEKKFKLFDVKIVYLPYTRNTSSTKINKILDLFIDKENK